MKRKLFSHEFVEFVPDSIHEGVLYVSVPYATVIHKCACGCGEEVVTPIGPTDWTLSWDGETVTLNPSIGNWGLPCQSHYWIIKNRIVWARKWGASEIEAGRAKDRRLKARYFQLHRKGHVSDSRKIT